jgi:uncharacterized zinc-type alcohol dehydrogenase-like protein
METTALQAAHSGAPLTPVVIRRRDLRPDDVDVRVSFCGVCHSDLHAIHAPADQGGSFPLVPGHEFVGEVVAIGDSVTSFSVGDQVAVGNIVDSCGSCQMCLAGQENFCEEFPTLTYGGRDRVDGSITDGAFAGRYVVREHFVYHLPTGLDPAGVAPIMCAGVTVWEPLRASGVGPGTRLGVVGLGGLGRALGAEVTVFTTTTAKAADARALGASHVVVSTDRDAMASSRGSMDVIVDTVSVEHDLSVYLAALDLDGTLFLLGYLGPVTVQALDLLVGRKRLASGGSGGHRSTQELLDFCGEHGIVADVEVVPAAEASEALERLARNDVRYRFVLALGDIDRMEVLPA